MSHTPGPWLTDERYPGNVYCDDSTGSIVAATGGFQFAPRAEGERDANARLIAAAPDLLDALKLFTSASMSESRPSRGESLIGWQKGDGPSASERVAIARAAIAKAVTP